MQSAAVAEMYVHNTLSKQGWLIKALKLSSSQCRSAAGSAAIQVPTCSSLDVSAAQILLVARLHRAASLGSITEHDVRLTSSSACEEGAEQTFTYLFQAPNAMEANQLQRA
jgi:hypothetical protein